MPLGTIPAGVDGRDTRGDKFYGKFDWKNLIADLGKSYYKELEFDRSLTTPPALCLRKNSRRL